MPTFSKKKMIQFSLILNWILFSASCCQLCVGNLEDKFSDEVAHLFVLRLNAPVNNLSVMSGWSQCFLCLTSSVGSLCVLLKDTTW